MTFRLCLKCLLIWPVDGNFHSYSWQCDNCSRGSPAPSPRVERLMPSGYTTSSSTTAWQRLSSSTTSPQGTVRGTSYQEDMLTPRVPWHYPSSPPRTYSPVGSAMPPAQSPNRYWVTEIIPAVNTQADTVAEVEGMAKTDAIPEVIEADYDNSGTSIPKAPPDAHDRYLEADTSTSSVMNDSPDEVPNVNGNIASVTPVPIPKVNLHLMEAAVKSQQTTSAVDNGTADDDAADVGAADGGAVGDGTEKMDYLDPETHIVITKADETDEEVHVADHADKNSEGDMGKASVGVDRVGEEMERVDERADSVEMEMEKSTVEEVNKMGAEMDSTGTQSVQSLPKVYRGTNRLGIETGKPEIVVVIDRTESGSKEPTDGSFGTWIISPFTDSASVGTSVACLSNSAMNEPTKDHANGSFDAFILSPATESASATTSVACLSNNPMHDAAKEHSDYGYSTWVVSPRTERAPVTSPPPMRNSNDASQRTTGDPPNHSFGTWLASSLSGLPTVIQSPNAAATRMSAHVAQESMAELRMTVENIFKEMAVVKPEDPGDYLAKMLKQRYCDTGSEDEYYLSVSSLSYLRPTEESVSSMRRPQGEKSKPQATGAERPWHLAESLMHSGDYPPEDWDFKSIIHTMEDGEDMPLEVRAMLAEALVATLGSKVVARTQAEGLVEQLETAVSKCDENTDIFRCSRLKANLNNKRAELDQAEDAVSTVLERLGEMANETAQAIVPLVLDDKQQCDAQLQELMNMEPAAWDTFQDLMECMANQGSLAVGEEVEVSVDGVATKAVVHQVLADDLYELSLWSTVANPGQRYEEGFRTSSPKYIKLPRHKIYQQVGRQQRLPDAMQQQLARLCKCESSQAGQSNPSYCYDARCLLFLYCVAEEARAGLKTLGQSVCKTVNTQSKVTRVIIPPLKPMPRAIEKVLGKYDGNYCRLTDIARMGFRCDTVLAALETFRAIVASLDFQFLTLKNRLRPDYDASETGGHRDVLLYLVHQPTTHIVEVQITLTPLVQVARSASHAVYAINRTLGLLKPENNRYEGPLNPEVLEAIASGLVQELTLCGGCHLTDYFDELITALRASKCVIRVLQLAGCDWPNEYLASPFLEAVMSCGSTLQSFHACGMEAMEGVLSDEFFMRCRQLTDLDLSDTSISGKLTSSIRRATKLKNLVLERVKLQGTLPPEIASLEKLEVLNLQSSGLAGHIPGEIGKLQHLRRLYLSDNGFSGAIPAALAALGNLEFLSLHKNQLCGPIPPEIGHLPKLKGLYLSENPLQGTIPKELANLENLEELFLFKSDLSGPIPVELGQLQRLEQLYLSENELVGCIPAEIGNLVSLQDLSLHTNNLSGPIPQELGQLVRLKKLSFCMNQLTGPIPADLGNLSQLERLYLHCNALSGPIPSDLGRMRCLTRLHLARNKLSGEIPKQLGELVLLEELFLHRNALIGCIPPELGNLCLLKKLRLYGNHLGGPIPPELGNLQSLQEMCLHINELSGPIPPTLGQLRELRMLYLNDNHLQGLIPPTLGQLGFLVVLSLSNNALTGPIPPELGYLDELMDLSLWGNQLQGPIPPELGHLAKLEHLALYSNCITGVIPAELGQLGHLKEFSLWGNQLEGPIPPELGQLEELEQLCLYKNNLTGCIPEELGYLRQLKELALWGNRLEGPIPDELGDLVHLQVLQLRSNALSGTIPTTLGRLTRLRELDLSKNNLEGPIPSSLGQLSELYVLSLQRNGLQGSIPADLCKLRQLRKLRLYGNKFYGPIPSELGKLETLEELALHMNSLCGTIPKDIGQLRKLKQMFLSDNQLVGSIPPELGDLHNLEVLSLANNALTGHIPPELGQLRHLKELSLWGNHLDGPIPQSLGELEKLEQLMLHSNGLSGSIPQEFKALKYLKTFTIWDTLTEGTL